MSGYNGIKKKYERFRYTQEMLEKAIKSIRNGETTLNKASKYYEIPKSTLHNKLTNKVPWERKMGPQTELGTLEEAQLSEWIIDKAKLGFPMHPDEVYDTVENYLNSNNRETKFKNNRPGEKWLALFLKRHPELTKRNAEMISKARAAVTEEGIRKWFIELDEFLMEENALDIKADPSRIFNTDETGVMTCPKTGTILGPKNYKDTYQIVQGKEKESITVLCTFSAIGNSVPPFVVYPYKRMPQGIGKEFPASWFIGRSDSGWMVSATFFAYIQLYYEWLVEHQIKLPVLLFLDGHKSHINREMFNFCREKGILLFCLHPNATHILQPCDVGIFGPIKKSWRKVVRKHKQATTAPITKQNFAPLFKKAFENGLKTLSIKNAFRACGLYPMNADAVNYSKCINTRRQEIAKKRDENPDRDDMQSTLKVIESEIEQTTRNEFIECYKRNLSHTHPLFPLWCKCKTKLEERQTNTQDLSGNASTQDIPLDLSNTSSIAASASQTNVAYNNSSTNSENENPNFEQIQELAQIHVDPALNDFQISTNLNDTDLFGDTTIPDFETTGDIIDYIVAQDPPAIIPLPWYDDLNLKETTTSSCLVELAIQPHIDKQNCTDSVQAPNNTDTQNDNSLSSNKLINFSEATVLPMKPYTIPLKKFLSYPEIPLGKNKAVKKKEPMPFGLTGQRYQDYLKKLDEEKNKKEDDIMNKRKKKEQEIQLRKRKIEEKKKIIRKDEEDIKNKQEEIQSQKPKINRQNKRSRKGDEKTNKNKDEEIPLQRKNKENIENIKKECQITNEENKKDQEIQTRKRQIEKKNENERPQAKRTNVTNINVQRNKSTKENEVTSLMPTLFGKYVIIRFATEKRMRYFVGMVILANDEERKFKIDFLRKRSVSDNIVTFIRPQVPDISEVDYADVQRVLEDPICSRRGLISFNDVSFKDIE